MAKQTEKRISQRTAEYGLRKTRSRKTDPVVKLLAEMEAKPKGSKEKLEVFRKALEVLRAERAQ